MVELYNTTAQQTCSQKLVLNSIPKKPVKVSNQNEESGTYDFSLINVGKVLLLVIMSQYDMMC